MFLVKRGSSCFLKGKDSVFFFFLMVSFPEK
jgi:hypothetical protein